MLLQLRKSNCFWVSDFPQLDKLPYAVTRTFSGSPFLEAEFANMYGPVKSCFNPGILMIINTWYINDNKWFLSTQSQSAKLFIIMYGPFLFNPTSSRFEMRLYMDSVIYCEENGSRSTFSPLITNLVRAERRYCLLLLNAALISRPGEVLFRWLNVSVLILSACSCCLPLNKLVFANVACANSLKCSRVHNCWYLVNCRYQWWFLYLLHIFRYWQKWRLVPFSLVQGCEDPCRNAMRLFHFVQFYELHFCILIGIVFANDRVC